MGAYRPSYEPSGWGTLAGDTSAPAPFNYYPGFNNAAQGQSMGIGVNVLGAGTGGPPLPVTNPYALGTAPIQRMAAGASGYASSFEKARAMNKPGGGLLTNAEAGSLYDQTGYMPSTTIGGNWNRPQLTTKHPLAHLSSRQQKDLMRVDANTAAYEAQQEARRAALSTGLSNDEAELFAGRRGLATRRDAAGNVIGLRGAPVMEEPIDPYTLEQRNVSYRALRGDEMAGRRGLVQENAARRSNARRDTLEARQRGPSLIDYIAARNPVVAMRAMELRQQGRIAEAELELRRGAQDIQRQEVEQRGTLASRGLDIEEGRTEAETRMRAEENALRRADTENRYRLGERGLDVADAKNRADYIREGERMKIADETAKANTAVQQGILAESQARTAITKGEVERRSEEAAAAAEERKTGRVDSLKAEEQALRDRGDYRGALRARSEWQSLQGTGGGGQVVAPNSYGEIEDPTLRARLSDSSVSGQEKVALIRNTYPDITQDQLNKILRQATGSWSTSEYNPDGFGFSDYVGGITGLENLNRLGSYWQGDYKGPRHWSGLPMPVVPGLGYIQTALGY